jgi:hypothetical protein
VREGDLADCRNFGLTHSSELSDPLCRATRDTLAGAGLARRQAWDGDLQAL